MPDDKLRLAKALENKAREEGFSAVGIAPARLAPETRQRLQQWLVEGRQGDMLWMENRANERSDPATLWPDVQTVIMLGMSYAPATDPFALESVGDHGRISVYAQGKDYHDAVKKRLKALARWLVAEVPGAEVKVFVDTAPVMEKPLGEAAGIGWQGKHTNLVSPEHGSWLFLGAIYTTLELPLAEPHRDQCGSCRACLDACPTGAFPAPYQIDARRCISYLTIEHKGPVAEDLRAALGNRIYGCDDCLAVCPWNKFAHQAKAIREFLPRAELVAPRLGELLALDDAGFRALFSGSPIKRIGRDRFVRNCLYAAGNSGNGALVPQVRALTNDPDPVVADAARWALARLTGSPSLGGGG